MRTGSITRTTAETDIKVSVNLDGTGVYDVNTGVGFLDHMVEQFSRHSLIDVTLREGRSSHRRAPHRGRQRDRAGPGDRPGAGRQEGHHPLRLHLRPDGRGAGPRGAGHFRPPDLVWKAAFSQPRLGTMDTEMFEHWFQSLSQAAGITLHIECLYGTNNHHIIEGIYKGFARAMPRPSRSTRARPMPFPPPRGCWVAERLALIDYGAGNLRSVANALKVAGATMSC
jgi:imidazoleglycerol-phosphate dehydratase